MTDHESGIMSCPLVIMFDIAFSAGSLTFRTDTRAFLKLTLHSGSSEERMTFLTSPASNSISTGDSRKALKASGTGDVEGTSMCLQLRGFSLKLAILTSLRASLYMLL